MAPTKVEQGHHHLQFHDLEGEVDSLRLRHVARCLLDLCIAGTETSAKSSRQARREEGDAVCLAGKGVASVASWVFDPALSYDALVSVYI